MASFEAAVSGAPEMARLLESSDPDYCDVFIHSLEEATVGLASNLRGGRFSPFRKTIRATRIEGAALRSIKGESVGFAVTHELSDGAMAKAAEDASHNIKPAVEAEDQNPFVEEGPTDPGSSDVDLALELADACLLIHDGTDSITVRVSDLRIRRAVAVGSHACVTDEGQRSEIRVAVEIDGGTVAVVKYLAQAADNSDLAAGIARELDSKVSAFIRETAQISTGRYQVILPAGWGGVWLHEAVGHQLETDSIAAGQSVLARRMGESVAPAFVTIIDDPSHPEGRVQQSFDDEGVPSAPTPLIDSGRLVGCLTARYDALTGSWPLTGNGRRAHYAHLPRSRMTNVILGAGPDDPDELRAGVSKGIDVADIRHAWLEPESSRIWLEVSRARLIENGKPSVELSPLLLTATPDEVLSGIVGLGNDFSMEVHRGYCRKDDVVIPVGVGQPTVLVDGMDARPLRISG